MMAELEDCTAVKKMKQGRLPFKPLGTLDQHVTGGNPPESKKRKLSENESLSSKQLKISQNTLDTVKPTSTECDHEVSSSSETELLNLGHPKGEKINTIDKFFKPKPVAHEQEEITSTNECILIDLTEDMVIDDLKCITKTNLPLDNDNGDDFQKISISTGDTASDMVYSCDPESIEELNVSSKNESAEDIGGNVKEDKENVDIEVMVIDKDCHSTADTSFIADSSVCEDALKTPVKDKSLKCMLKAESSCSFTPSQDSASDRTPSSVKIISKPISESKRKEREEQRNCLSGTKEEREQKRLQKQKEKDDKEQERLEKKRQKEEEKAEKEKLKQEEKDKKDREKLEKLKQKEEEKKLREKELEAKLEEKRKKDEEKKQKDEEKRLKEEEKKKEEEEKLRKEEKKKEMFKGFFIKKDPIDSPPKPKENKNGLFMPFELKPHMKLAPGHRRSSLTVERKLRIDEAVSQQVFDDRLYLDCIKSPSFKAGKSSATWPRKIPGDDDIDDDDDVEFLSHEKETIEKVTHHVKFLHFEENTRPPYYGTWRKCSKVLTGRNPFKQDQSLFDYEVDSDDEWEEEEPGESVSSDEEDEEAEKNEDDDPDADDWMVPHGYLSDGEGVDDDEVDKASKQDLQKVRQAAWESELKRQAKPLKMVSIGCVWEDDNMIAIADQQLEILLKFKAVCLLEEPIDTTFKLRVSDTDASTKVDKQDDRLVKHNPQRKSVPEEAIPDLIRLVHGNPIGIKNLIKEFRMFWKLKTNPDAADSSLDLSMKVDVSATDTPKSLKESRTEANKQFQISKRQLEFKIPAIGVREKRPDHKKVCWYVREEVLKQYNMADITLPNSWEYVCVKKPTWAEDKTPKVDDGILQRPAGKATPTILQFAQPMSPTRLQAIGPFGGNTIRESDRQEAGKDAPAVVEKTPETPGKADTLGKPIISSDQRSIKDMFSPGLLKQQNKLNKSTRCLTNNTVNNNVMVTDVNRSSMSNYTLNKSVKIILQSINGKTATQKVPGHNVNSKLSSPECTKTLPKLNKDLKDCGKDPEQPMEIDLIVID